MSRFYHAFGLNIHSTLPLPELDQAAIDQPAHIDVAVRLGTCPADGFPHPPGPGHPVQVQENETLFYYGSAGRCLVRHGSEIILDPLPGITGRELGVLIVGPLLAMLLSQRDVLVLHASAAAFPRGVIGFLGQKRQGKSVLVAHLAELGYRMVADDLTAVINHDGAAAVLPARSRVRLWPDALEALGHSGERLPLVHPASDKRGWQAPPALSGEPLRLSRLYVLSQADAPSTHPLAPSAAFVELLRYSYLSRWPEAMAKIPALTGQIAWLADHVPVFRLDRPHDYAALPAVVRLVEAHDSG